LYGELPSVTIGIASFVYIQMRGSSTMENIVYRKLNENDLDVFINLRILFLKETTAMSETEKCEIENSLKIYFDKYINTSNFIGIIAEHNGNVVSVAYLNIYDKPANPNITNGKTGSLMNVYTFPEYRRKGISEELIKIIIKEAKNLGIKYIDLLATEAGYNLYKKLGFNDTRDKSMSIKI